MPFLFSSYHHSELMCACIIGNCILPHTEEAVMGTLKAERNSINIVETTALALIKRNINKELDV